MRQQHWFFRCTWSLLFRRGDHFSQQRLLLTTTPRLFRSGPVVCYAYPPSRRLASVYSKPRACTRGRTRPPTPLPIRPADIVTSGSTQERENESAQAMRRKKKGKRVGGGGTKTATSTDALGTELTTRTHKMHNTKRQRNNNNKRRGELRYGAETNNEVQGSLWRKKNDETERQTTRLFSTPYVRRLHPWGTHTHIYI